VLFAQTTTVEFAAVVVRMVLMWLVERQRDGGRLLQQQQVVLQNCVCTINTDTPTDVRFHFVRLLA